MGEAENLNKILLQDFINPVAEGSINITVDKIFSLNQIVQAHNYMEGNQAKGNIIIAI
jgi:NADPH2:quinone reductase